MRCENNTPVFSYIVRQMLINRSQPQPVIKNAAAGGKMIATCKAEKKNSLQSGFFIILFKFSICIFVMGEYNTRTRMRQTSEPRTDILLFQLFRRLCVRGGCSGGVGYVSGYVGGLKRQVCSMQ